MEIFLGLGSNLGDREKNLDNALDLLEEQGVQIKNRSPLYETDPVGYLEQPCFLNAVMQGTTELSPQELLLACKDIEKRMGRRPSFRNAPRPIDIDILFYGQEIIEQPDLVIPHKEIVNRAFVLVPLADLAPVFIHPVAKKTIADLLAKVEGKEGVRFLY